jgi:mycothiol synthase
MRTMTQEEQLDWRPMRPSDVSGWARLLAAAREADHSWEYFTEQDLLEDFTDPSRDFEYGSIAVFAGDSMIGYGILMPRTAAEPVHEMRYEGCVHPQHRGSGIGTKLLEWSEAAASLLHEERFPGYPLSLSANCPTLNVGAVALYEQRSYRPVRWFNAMVKDLSLPLEERCAPPGVEIASWSRELLADSRMIRNEAFRDHWGSTETTAESWEHSMASAAFRPEFSFVAYVDSEPAGCVISHEYEIGPDATARDLYISLVGTRRAHRGRGIATALLTRALSDARAAGFETGSLEVDADSPTGALGLYVALGFAVNHRSVTLTKSIKG